MEYLPGRYYYGRYCDVCDKFIPIVLDDELQPNFNVRLTGTYGMAKCWDCGHVQRYHPRDLIRLQAPEA